MKKYLSGVLVAGLMFCGMALAQAPAQQDQPKAEHKAKTSDKASRAQMCCDSGKSKAGEPKAQRTGDTKEDRGKSSSGGARHDKTDKQGDKTKAKTKK